ncbi:hypothetical protein T265_00065 [Opisthorchis viverrini]|uniref:CBM21 domain-containing protein n=2 Tax=Opisthorchis viverrini TaxID=6198 RepID=A0A075AJY7_OPIVI|nr:hypothetical protein T265_00065 [Opisthorchis viverrini]KER34204.1 hypothetical protein T265_00065 [Opisthorchis viverrini]
MGKTDKPLDTTETETSEQPCTSDDLPRAACSKTTHATSSKDAPVDSIMLTADRHQGWHTEFTADPPLSLERARRATDYVVQTSFMKDSPTGQKTRSGERKRVNLVVRFRSLLSRRGSSRSTADTKHHRAHKILLNNLEGKASRVVNSERLTSTPRTVWPSPSQSLDAAVFNPFKRSRSDSFLRRGCHPQFDAAGEPSDSTQPGTSYMDTALSPTAIPEQLPSTECNDDLTKQMLSLSTGNICCLFALRCEPSVEYLTTSANQYSSRPRRLSLPVSSLKSTTTNPASLSKNQFALNLLKEHPCFQDVHSRLNDWVRNALDNTVESDKGNLTKVYVNDEQDFLGRRVRFADEAAFSSSATTLNSLSASSSARSLCSLTCPQASHSPIGSLDQVTVLPTRNYETYLKPTPAPVARPKSPVSRFQKQFCRKLKRDNARFAEGGGSSFELSSAESGLQMDKMQRYREKSPSVAQRLWHKKKSRHHETKGTPMVTVNVIKDSSEPPEVPSHVLRELHVEEDEPRWCNLFANPEDCSNFNQRLARQHVCLGRLLSTHLSHIEATVHVVAPSPFMNLTPFEVRLRYTLNHWVTNMESAPLKKVFIEKRELTTSEAQWVELYRGVVDIPTNSLPESQWLTEFGQFEFAVVARREQFEIWDNNDRQNYVCFRGLPAD